MNLRLEENYLVSTRTCVYGRMLMHTCFQDLSLNPPGLCAHFLPLCTPKSAQSQAHFMCRLSHPSARYHTLPYLTRMDLDYLLQATINPLLPILSRAQPRNLSQ